MDESCEGRYRASGEMWACPRGSESRRDVASARRRLTTYLAAEDGKVVPNKRCGCGGWIFRSVSLRLGMQRGRLRMPWFCVDRNGRTTVCGVFVQITELALLRRRPHGTVVRRAGLALRYCSCLPTVPARLEALKVSAEDHIPWTGVVDNRDVRRTRIRRSHSTVSRNRTKT